MSSVLVSDQRSSIADYAYLVVNKYTKIISKYESNIFTQKDPENLHQLRVAMRKLRSILQIFDGVLDLPPLVTEKNIGKFAKVLGKQRDLDIIQINLTTKYLNSLPKKEQKCLDRLIKKQKKAHKKSDLNPQTILNSKAYQNLKKDLKEWLDNPQYKAIAALNLGHNLPFLLSPQICQFTLQSGWLVGTKKLDNGDFSVANISSIKKVNEQIDKGNEQLHQLRKEAKKTRYQLELFADFYPHKYQEYITFAKQTQQILGDIQDNICLQEYLSKSVGQKWNKKLPHLQELIKEDQFKLWQKWQGIQTQIITQNYSQNLQSLISDRQIYLSESQLENN